MYESRSGLVNGELVNDLLELCNEFFTSPFVKPYAGANNECLFCGAMENSKGGAEHSAADCPVIKYKDIAEKHSSLIKKSKEEDYV